MKEQRTKEWETWKARGHHDQVCLTCIAHSRFHPNCREPSEPVPWPGSGTPRLLTCSAPAGREHQPAGNGPGNLRRRTEKASKNKVKTISSSLNYVKKHIHCQIVTTKTKALTKSVFKFLSGWTLSKGKILNKNEMTFKWNVKQGMLLTHSQEDSQCKSHEFHGWALKENTAIIPSKDFWPRSI